jgi:hypothetical protein
MTHFELLSILTACVALVISLIVWSGQRKLQREANDLQRATAELSRRQLESIEREEAAAKVANLELRLEEQGNGYVLALTNFGPEAAHDVRLISLGEGVEDSLLVQDEYEAKFPVARLLPGTRVGLTARVYLGSPSKFLFHLRWRDGTGERSEDISVAPQQGDA